MAVFDFSDRYIKFFESRVQFLLTTAARRFDTPFFKKIFGKKIKTAEKPYKQGVFSS